MEQYEDEGTRRRQFGGRFTNITDFANKLHEETTANVAFVGVEETGRVVSHSTPPGIVLNLSRAGYVPTDPMGRLEVAENDLDLTEVEDGALEVLDRQIRTAMQTVVEEKRSRS